jgi:hypothetical protein
MVHILDAWTETKLQKFVENRKNRKPVSGLFENLLAVKPWRALRL